MIGIIIIVSTIDYDHHHHLEAVLRMRAGDLGPVPRAGQAAAL